MANPHGNALFRGENHPRKRVHREMRRALEREFDEPLRDIIVTFRQQGNSWRTIAGAMGIGFTTLNRWRKKLGLPIDRNDICRDMPMTRARHE